jgi:hypothetical protein
MPSYGHVSSADPEEDLRLLHKYLSMTSLYFDGVKRRLLLTDLPGTPDADTVALLCKTRDALATASRACGPGSTSSGTSAGEEYVFDLMAATEPLSEQIQGVVIRAWEQLLEGTDRGRPNALLLATCFAVDATERFLGEVEGFVARVLGVRELPSVRGGAPPRVRGRRRGRVGEVKGTRERDRESEQEPFVHPSRRRLVRRALDRSRRARPVLRPRWRRVCIEL